MEKKVKVRGYTRKGKPVQGYERSQEEVEKEKAPPIQVLSELEFAPGIPASKRIRELPTINKPVIWEQSLQKHKAVRAGLHYDMRIGDPATGVAYSWALPKAEIPEPGSFRLAVRTFDHRTDYMPFRGEITERYGKGTVALERHDKTEVMEMSPDKIRFNLYDKKAPEEFMLNRVGRHLWLLHNVTVTRNRHPEIPKSKPQYKSTPIGQIDVGNDDQIMEPKIDGAHVLVHFRKAGEHPRVYSYRPAKDRPHDLIEHTHKFMRLRAAEVPKSLEGTILRGEAYAEKNGKVRPATVTAGILNSKVLESREKQKELGDLRVTIFDVANVKGEDKEDLSYRDKLSVLKKAHDAIPELRLPEMAVTPQEKRTMLERVRSGKHPVTDEGVVLWSKSSSERYKSVRRPDHDVIIRRIEEGKGRLKDEMAGGFSYSLHADGPRGEIKGTVGSGLSDALRKDMSNNPHKYIGATATVRARKQFESGALRAPSFYRMHPDK